MDMIMHLSKENILHLERHAENTTKIIISSLLIKTDVKFIQQQINDKSPDKETSLFTVQGKEEKETL